ncbi:hypothetical protein [Halalkalibacter alkalisediminis]|uniref:hypothetical protein n=1 Tax=Halalkalibacter alkalisediminis TaxID=935616 RepID=UPI002362A2FB|nr:hypothetical protein [Halalkalibacter alkalisediminis]
MDIQALLSQFDGEVPELGHIEFFIWKNGEEQKKQYFSEHADVGNGIYRVTTIIEDEGLYFVKLVANTSESKVMPTKQFTVGSLSELDSIHCLRRVMNNIMKVIIKSKHTKCK